ncbi:MAG: hypothetical protein RLQ12_05635 [Cyclobacteriaceae bacterium]
MNQLRITFITLAIFASIEGFSQDQTKSSAHVIVNPQVGQLNANNQNIGSTDSTNLAMIAKLPMNAIHFQNKGTRPKIEVHWEDSMVQNESFDLDQSNSSKSKMVTQYKP